ncbi:TPA: hypothetical protein LA742_002345 [Clostridium botulinum]|nr:hypothetical protein [Clostridium botulinum]
MLYPLWWNVPQITQASFEAVDIIGFKKDNSVIIISKITIKDIDDIGLNFDEKVYK